MGLLFGQLAKEVCVSVVCQKAMKSFGKKDYADVIRLGGWCIYGCTIVQIYHYIIQNSLIINFFKGIF